MPRWVKAVFAVGLLPLCVSTALALVRVVRATGEADTVWAAMLGGAACWLVIFSQLPKPMRVYVFGHELTHALWTWLCGGRVTRFKAGATGGHVVVTKTNFLIVLAPYFFPVYAFLVIAIFCVGDWIWNWEAWRVWFHLLLGVAYAFHVTFTLHVLRRQQTDITSQGYLFSAVVVWLGNLGVLLLGLPSLTGMALTTASQWWLEATGDVFGVLARWVQALA